VISNNDEPLSLADDEMNKNQARRKANFGHIVYLPGFHPPQYSLSVTCVFQGIEHVQSQ
jgi:hypothetical protein